MPRHQGVYKPDNNAPFELSRSAIEKMICWEACFWLEKVVKASLSLTTWLRAGLQTASTTVYGQ